MRSKFKYFHIRYSTMEIKTKKLIYLLATLSCIGLAILFWLVMLYNIVMIALIYPVGYWGTLLLPILLASLIVPIVGNLIPAIIFTVAGVVLFIYYRRTSKKLGGSKRTIKVKQKKEYTIVTFDKNK